MNDSQSSRISRTFKDHAMEIQVSTFSIHHFQDLNEKLNLHSLAYGVQKVKTLHSN